MKKKYPTVVIANTPDCLEIYKPFKKNDYIVIFLFICAGKCVNLENIQIEILKGQNKSKPFGVHCLSLYITYFLVIGYIIYTHSHVVVHTSTVK